MAKFENNVPDVIVVEFKYERRVKSSHFHMEFEDFDFCINEMTANSVYSTLDEMTEDERSKVKVVHWVPSESRLGHTVQYRIDGNEFMKHAKLKNIGD